MMGNGQIVAMVNTGNSHVSSGWLVAGGKQPCKEVDRFGSDQLVYGKIENSNYHGVVQHYCGWLVKELVGGHVHRQDVANRDH